jgi:citrate synthase
MDALRGAIGQLPPRGELAADAVATTGAMAVFAAAWVRGRSGLPPVAPDPGATHAADYLRMVTGESVSAPRARALDRYLVTVSDHGMNASTFTARVIASTQSDMVSAVTGAIGALKGPLHGGANSAVMNVLESIGSPDRVEEEIRARLERREKIPGFGHRVYKTMDPRAAILKEHARALAEQDDSGEPNWFELSERVERLMLAEKGLYPNVDFYSASTYHYLGFPTDLFTTLFVASRVVGWSAHVIEQHRDNRIIRPNSEYVGPDRREFPALSQRP